jgi:adenylate kinase family enzyme
MQRVVIFGNSGSGKSTLARHYTAKYELSHLDLDMLAWQDTNPPLRKPLKESAVQINQFLEENKNWVIEGCYADLLSLMIKKANEVIFLNPGVETCINNCRNRPWEPHKYRSQEAQNRNLDRLLEWVEQYPLRNDEFSLTAHQKLFHEFVGKKTEYKSNDRNA